MTVPLDVVAYCFSGVVLGGIALGTLDQRANTGAGWFVLTMAAWSLTAFIFAVLSVLAPNGLATTSIGYLFVILLPIPWTFFSFQYSGNARYLSGTPLLLIVSPVVLGVGAVASSIALTGGEGVGTLIRSADSTARLAGAVIVIAEVISIFHVAGLGFVSAALLIKTTTDYGHLPRALGPLLSVGALGSWFVLFAGLQLYDADRDGQFALFILLGVLIAVACFSIAWLRYDLFDLVPAADAERDQLVVEDMDVAVVVVDEAERIINVNPDAEQTLGIGRSTVLGDTLDSLLDRSLDELRSSESFSFDGGPRRRLLDASISSVTDQHERELGHVIILRDVTETRMREQRLEVLNRVLRHNLRNDMATISGYSQQLTERDNVPEAEIITKTAEKLLSISERAREAEQLLSRDHASKDTVDLPALFEQVRQQLADQHPGVDLTVTAPDADVSVDRVLLERILCNLGDNAASYNDAELPRVQIDATLSDHQLVLSVTDNGPGIPAQEREVIVESEETALEHGSGLGLWIVNWSVARLGGTLEFDENDPRGSVVTVRLPVDPDARSEPQVATVGAVTLASTLGN